MSLLSANVQHLQLELSKVRPLAVINIRTLLRAFFTVRYMDDAKGQLYVLEVLR